MQGDVELVIRRAITDLPPLDVEDFDQVCLDQEGWPESICAEGFGMINVGKEDPSLVAIDEERPDEDIIDDTDITALAREFGAPVKINGMPIDPEVDLHNWHSLPNPEMSPYEDEELAETPRDPDTPEHVMAVLYARYRRDHRNLSRVRKIDPHKGPGRERGRELIRKMRERGDIAA